MDLDGACLLRTPLPRLRAGLTDPAFPGLYLAWAENLEPRPEGGHGFTLNRRLAGAPLRLRGEIALTPRAGADLWHLAAVVSAPLAGSVRLAVDLDLTAEPEGGAWLAYRGTLSAGGVLSRILQARRAQIEDRLQDELRRIDVVLREMDARPEG